ncbi:hypothetical protein PPYR_06242 [Photinus pyralis]|uniref:Uncharacterized protein n=1 Tax=Photinus pyralis TaxID=7054 RepID=A0A5N4AT07_PHOPY|nr:uncharacterized protein LOC116166903 isoform X2 [Photinus pyralis]KAB0800502.1 hypothetical protein PPYR_06242 [Photinus pyralis]
MALSEYPTVNNNLVQEGIAHWNKKREADEKVKLEEQIKMREMLERYWPWGKKPQPRGYRNLKLDEIIPSESVRPLGLGRSVVGRPQIRTKEHPIIRFQWNEDLRKCVDNTIRYKTSKEQCTQYRKQLDAQVAERKMREKWEKENETEFYRRSGWSTENTLKSLASKPDNHHEGILKEYENFKKAVNSEGVRLEGDKSRNDRFLNERIESALNKRRLSPLKREKVNGEELVSLLAKQRVVPKKMHLGTTDVTRGNNETKKHTGSDYLQNLTNQMEVKRQYVQELKEIDVGNVRRHFESLDNFWGRPGNGAPRSTLKKGCLDRLLYNIYA